MAAVTSKGAESLLENKLHRFAHCWQLVRKDGFTFRFTDHDHQLTLLDGSIYQPVGGFSATASQRQVGLRDNNLEIDGMFDSSAITYDDLRAGKYREAKITEHLVDWMYPWAGDFGTNVFWIAATKLIDNKWEASLKGFALWLNRPIGTVLTRDCENTLGDAKCTVALGPFTFAGAANAIISKNIKFTTTGAAAAKANGYFDLGKLTWTTGPNVGIVSEVRTFLNSGGTFALQMQTPFAIANGDQFSAVIGCDKITATCKTVFSNLINFRGAPQLPGTGKMLQAPQTKNV